MGQPLPFWQTKPRYDGADYDLTHLQPLDRTLHIEDQDAIQLTFRFSYHCCTDKLGNRGLGTRILEESRPDETRHFCPVRWFLSLQLPALAKSLGPERLTRSSGFQWVHRVKVPGISLQWNIWLKVMPGPPNGRSIVAIETAFLGAAPPQIGTPETFKFVVRQTRRSNQLYGIP